MNMTKAHTSLNERNQSEKAKQKSRKAKYKLYQKKKERKKGKATEICQQKQKYDE